MAKAKKDAPTSGKGSHGNVIKLHKYYKGILALMGPRVRKSPFNPLGRTEASIYKEMLVNLEYELKNRAATRGPKQPRTSDEV